MINHKKIKNSSEISDIFDLDKMENFLDDFEESDSLDFTDFERYEKDSYNLKKILEISKHFKTIYDEKELYGKVLEEILDMLGAEKGAIIFTPPDTEFAFVSFKNYTPIEQESFEKIVSQTIIKKSIRTKKTVFIKDTTSINPLDLSKSIERLEIRSVLSVPLIYEEDVFGVIYIDNRQKNSFTERELEIIDHFADQAAISIKNMLLVKEIKDKNIYLEKLVEEKTHEKIIYEKRAMEQEKFIGFYHIAAGFSHYINNQLAGISGNAEIVKYDYQGKYKDNLDKIMKMSFDIKGFTEKILAYSKITDEQHEEKVDVCELITDVLTSNMSHEFKNRGIKIRKSKCSKYFVINGSRSKMLIIIKNILENSMESFDNFLIDDKIIEIRLVDDGEGKIILFIEDNGKGIKEEYLGNVYNPLFTTKGSISEGEHSGIGMGLSNVKKYLIEMGGEIDIQSREGKGTLVKIIFNNKI